MRLSLVRVDMHTLRVAAVFILVYAVTQLLGSGFYVSWSGDASEVPRMLFRVVGSGIIAYGLWTTTRWGWWLGMIFSAVVVLFGIVGLTFGWAIGLFAGRPYLAVEILIFAVSVGAMAGALVYLLMPSSRQVVLPE